MLNISGSGDLLKNLNSTLLQKTNSLETLDLGSLQLWESENGNQTNNIFSNLPKLGKLLMSNVTIHGYGQNYCSCNETSSVVSPNLTSIDLYEAKCANCSFPNSIAQFRNVTELDFSFSRDFSIISTPANPRFPALQTLILTGGSFDVVDPSGLLNLRTWDLSGIRANNLTLSRLPELELLKFSGKSFNWESDGFFYSDTTFDAVEIPELENLTRVDFSNVRIEKLTLRNFNKLQDVQLFNASIKVLNIENNGLLKSLNLGGGNVSDISLKNLPNLEDLNLSRSKFKTIQIEDCRNISYLDMSYVTKIDLINQVNISRFENLKNVNLSSCDLFEVPEVFSGLSSLHSLDLSHNFLDLLPDNFLPDAGTCSLTNLDLSDNFFEVIPYEIIKPMTGNLDNLAGP